MDNRRKPHPDSKRTTRAKAKTKEFRRIREAKLHMKENPSMSG